MTQDRSPAPGAAAPRRRLQPAELRALAHPLRLRLLEDLMLLGEATATELGERVGESPANCSWHLRQLARYGFIEDAGGGTGRERPWRWVRASLHVSADEDETPEARMARDAAVGIILDREIEAFRAWQMARVEAPESWSEASFDTSTVNWLTPDELAELRREVSAVIEHHVLAHLDRIDPARRPAEARLVRFVSWGFPAGPVEELASGREAGADDGGSAS